MFLKSHRKGDFYSKSKDFTRYVLRKDRNSKRKHWNYRERVGGWFRSLYIFGLRNVTSTSEKNKIKNFRHIKKAVRTIDLPIQYLFIFTIELEIVQKKLKMNEFNLSILNFSFSVREGEAKWIISKWKSHIIEYFTVAIKL